ncbi:MAG: hypothetical protein Ct9H300mP11_05450 [Chloroflexota bacterium]|nr:MAG: hypothetical protein Ct9H300mP11_05450 [Chloroflexota bacterium]
MSLPGDPFCSSHRPQKIRGSSGRRTYPDAALGGKDIRPRDILTKQAFENAITVAVSMGGSTNSVLHLMAIAHEAGVDLSLEDFDRISRNTPYITDMKPGGKYVMADLSRYGGIALVMKRLLNAGLLHGDTMTVTGKTLREK